MKQDLINLLINEIKNLSYYLTIGQQNRKIQQKDVGIDNAVAYILENLQLVYKKMQSQFETNPIHIDYKWIIELQEKNDNLYGKTFPIYKIISEKIGTVLANRASLLAKNDMSKEEFKLLNSSKSIIDDIILHSNENGNKELLIELKNIFYKSYILNLFDILQYDRNELIEIELYE